MKCRQPLILLKLLVIITILIPGFLTPGLALAAEPTVVTVSAPGPPVDQEETFIVNIDVVPGTAIAGVQFNLNFDPSLVTVNSVVEGDLLAQGGASTYFMPGVTDNEAGTISGVAGAIITPGQTVSTTGTFAVITMTARPAQGVCSLTLVNTIIGDIQGESIPVSVVNGEVAVDINRPPVLSSIGNKSIYENNLLEFTISAVDPDGDTLTYSASNLPSGASFNPDTKIFSWTPISEQAGTYPNVYFEVGDGELTDSEYITITVNGPSSPSGGAGGGGGGGAAGLTSLIDTITTEGRITQNTIAESDDGEAELFIPKNTIGLTETGHPLSRIIMRQMEEPPEPPTDTNVIGLTYDFTPDGATFSPSATLTFSYDPELILEGIAEESLVIAVWDEDTGEWAKLECTVNPTTNTISAQISHFTAFAVLAYPSPAAFTTTDLGISPAEVNPGDTVTISASVTNTGSVSGSTSVTLKIDNVVTATKDITLAGGTTQQVTFTISRDSPGIFTIDINGITDSFTVSATVAPVDEETAQAEEAPQTGPIQFSVTPIYDAETGKLTSASIDYHLDNINEPMADVRLVLDVTLDGEPIGEVLLLSSSHIEPGTIAINRDYIPSQEWSRGTYTFKVTLYVGEEIYSSTAEKNLEVTAESATPAVNWAILGVIIASMLITGIVITLVILRRRYYI